MEISNTELISQYIQGVIASPLIYGVILFSFLHEFVNFNFNNYFTTYVIYVLSFPFIIILLSLFLSHKIKFNNYLLPLLIFIILQLVPLPRSQFVSSGTFNIPDPRSEPFAIGLGYPFSFVKYFFGEGCLNTDIYGYKNGEYIRKDKCLNDQRNNYAHLKKGNFKAGEAKDTIHKGDIVFFPPGTLSFFSVGLFLYSYFISLKLITSGSKSKIQPSINEFLK